MSWKPEAQTGECCPGPAAGEPFLAPGALSLPGAPWELVSLGSGER